MINLPERSLVIDLAPVFVHEGGRFAAGEAAVNAAALRCFVWLAGDQEMTALDWQHSVQVLAREARSRWAGLASTCLP